MKRTWKDIIRPRENIFAFVNVYIFQIFMPAICPNLLLWYLAGEYNSLDV